MRFIDHRKFHIEVIIFRLENNSQSLVECPGRTYPSDLWFLIVRYISVEDLVNFALLCRGAYEGNPRATMCTKNSLRSSEWKSIISDYSLTEPFLLSLSATQSTELWRRLYKR